MTSDTTAYVDAALEPVPLAPWLTRAIARLKEFVQDPEHS
jgi:hypothetical protein